ncbi:MAG: hypothetical protein QNJ98_03580 [Planctomycetota bacterium]|nr:hypothetical protein [Planctomycetota bacterium]
MRPSALLALALLLVPLAGCGDPAPTIRVQIETAPEDGPVDVELALVHAGPDRTRYPLRPIEGAAPGVMEADAPTGHYFVQSAPGWDQLRVKPDAFYFQANPDLAPQSVYVGKAGTLYVAMRDRDQPPVSREWAVQRIHADGSRTPLTADVYQAFEGVVGIRPLASEWRGTLRVVGRRVDGLLLNPMEVRLGDPGPDRPRVRLMIASRTAELGVRLVAPAGMEAVPDGYTVRVQVLGIPLEAVQTARAREGIAAFPLVPHVPEGVRVEAGGVAHELPGTFLDDRGAVHVLALTDATAAVCGLTGPPGGGPIDEVRVRPKGRRQYARARVDPVEAGDANRVLVRTCRGPQRWIVRSGTRFAELEVDVAGPEGTEAKVTAWTDGASARGEVRDTRGGASRAFPPGHRLLFVRTEGKSQVLGEGFDVRIPSVGRYAITLPPGRYSVRVQGPRGLVGRAQILELAPGVSLSRAFEIE